MSTKTLRKRIALVAVSAMGFGLLSSVAANAATAGSIAITANGTSTSTASRGIVSINGASGTTSLSASTATTNYMSVVSNGWVYVQIGTGSGPAGSATVTNGYFSAADNAASLNAGSTAVTGTTSTSVGVIVKPTSGSTQSVITAYSDATFTTSVGVLTINWVPATSTGVFNQGQSFFAVKATAAAASTNKDANSGASLTGTGAVLAGTTVLDGKSGYLGWAVNDANGAAVTYPVVTTTTTGGCLLNTADSTGTMSQTYTNNASSGYIRVNQPTAHVPATCTVTMSVGGVVAATRTFTFQGQVVKIKIDSVALVKAQSGANTSTIYAEALDAAGNSIDGVALNADSTYLNSNLTAVSTITTAPFADGSVAADGAGDITCINSSSNKMKLTALNASAATISSDEFTINCAGDPANYSAKLDKSSYVPGDIATLTITAKDSKGQLTNDAAVVGSTAKPIAIAGSNLTAVTSPTNVDTFTSGVKTYKFVVGSTEGNYQLTVDLPKWDSTTYSQSALTLPYEIKASTTAVSNADVLAAIVKLIASINKQIAALQKALMKK